MISATIPRAGSKTTYTSGWPKNQNRCCHNTGSPPPEGTKNVVPTRWSIKSMIDPAINGPTEAMNMMEAKTIIQTTIGMSVIRIPGARAFIEVVTKLIPKPMVKIGNKPILCHIMDIYKFYGFKDFILATGYKNKIIENFFKKKNNVKCIFTGKNSMTGGRILKLKKYFKKNENFMLTYGDGLTNQNITDLV